MLKLGGGILFVLALVAIANIGELWLGRSFKIGFAVLVVLLFVITWIWAHRREKQLMRNLAEMDRESQDAVLAELDAKERNEILQKLGRGKD